MIPRLTPDSHINVLQEKICCPIVIPETPNPLRYTYAAFKVPVMDGGQNDVVPFQCLLDGRAGPESQIVPIALKTQ